MNELYGTLVNSPNSGELYYRNTTRRNSLAEDIGVILPQTTDKAYIQFCADQLCRLCASVFPDSLKELDPQNTYEYPTTVVESTSTVVYGQPSTVNVAVFDTLVAYPYITKSMSFHYDGVDTFTFEGKRMPWNNGSGVFEYAGLRFSFNGPAASSFKGTVEVTRRPTRSLIDLDRSIKAFKGTEWSDEFEPYRDASLITQRVAAFTLNALGRALR
jgi:hypothetical protein